MTLEKKKEYLLRYQLIDKKIEHELEGLALWKEKAKKVTAVLTGLPGPQSKTGGMQNICDKVMDMEKEVGIHIEKMLQLKQELESIISAVPHEIYRLLLQYRYLDFMLWEHIAVRLNYNYYYVRKELHKKALELLIIPSDTLLIRDNILS